MKFIKGQILVQNNVWLADAPIRPIPCEDSNVVALYWLVPQVMGGAMKGYMPRLRAADDKPSLDSIRAIRVINYGNGFDYYIAAEDDATISLFAETCNNCCDTVDGDLLPTITIPIVINEQTPCPTVPTEDPVYDFFFQYPDNPNNFNFALRASFNGDYATPPAPGGGFADPDATLAWVQANWDTLGTWENIVGDDDQVTLHLNSTTTISAGVAITLLDAVYCFAAPLTDTQVNGIRIGGVIVSFPTVTFKSDTLETLLNAVNPYLDGDLIIVASNTGGPRKLQYTGLQVPQDLRMDGSVVSGTTFTAGTCPNIFEFAIPAQGNANNYLTISGTFNAVAGTPTPSAPGYATPTALLSFLTGSWSAYGTWTLIDSNTKVKLVSDTTTTAVVTITEIPALYCMTVKTGPYNADGIMVDGVQVLFGASVIGITSASYAALRSAIATAMPTATVTDAGSSKIQISSKHIPTTLRLSNADVAAQAFTLGAC
jgi:hypothetical protein